MPSAAGPTPGAPSPEAIPPGRDLAIGLDVGSTTVKAVVADLDSHRILWKDYRRHGARQAEVVLDFLARIEASFPDLPPRAFRLLITGSGGGALAALLSAKFVQEVNAVCLAVERLHPEADSVVDLGGQDAKIVVFRRDQDTGRKLRLPTMNDKCAGGTGAVIDRIAGKLRISPEELRDMPYRGVKLHNVAGKCGVFAETDINGLQKQGVPAAELMASLFESIVQQNLSVLTRGNTLRPVVLLLGGPNRYLRGLPECWTHHLIQLWEQRGVVASDPARAPEDCVVVPEDGEYFAALGLLDFARAERLEDAEVGRYAGREALERHLARDRQGAARAGRASGLWESREELRRFRERYRPEPWEPPRHAPGSVVEAFVGLDGGSTSTKAVLLDRAGRVLAKAYRLSGRNPISDATEVLAALERQILDQGCRLRVLGLGTTGYAKDILKQVLQADVALVETVAHAASGLHYFPGTDVIVDVGGQDIKLVVLRNGHVKDFKLNTQCSAGNGYFLQGTAQLFGVEVEQYAETAFAATRMPEFGHGCAVFLQSDIVDFQRQGWTPSEILAGLAEVLPKNVWLYVSQTPNLARLGTRFVLQGGTHRNLAAVKAQVRFIESRFGGTGITPEIVVHPHCGESGAIGCALHVRDMLAERAGDTRFIGMERARRIEFRTTRSEETRCPFCKNRCLRTFVDVNTGESPPPAPDDSEAVPVRDAGRRSSKRAARVPLGPGERRVIVASCEKGASDDVDAVRRIQKGLEALGRASPDLVAAAARQVFAPVAVECVADRPPWAWLALAPARRHRRRQRAERMERRARLRIGIPRVLNLWGLAPFFRGYFQALGVPPSGLVFSDATSEELYRRGARRGAIDPCYPSKLGIPHLHDLLEVHHARQPLTHVFFPMIDSFPTPLEGVLDCRSCPTVTVTPEASYAAFVKEGDSFAERGIVFRKTLLHLAEPQLCAREMLDDWGEELGLRFEESYRAAREGLRALAAHEAGLRRRAREILDRLERERRLGVVVLGRPYHHDPGIHHGICAELHKLGYPILPQDVLPTDPDLLERLFGEEVRQGLVRSPLSIEDVWKKSYSEHTSRKLWAARFVARHPNLVALELSSFKCGHDAPVYSVIEEIVESSGTPYFGFKDLDENKSTGSIRIRIETIAHCLERHRDKLFGRPSGAGP